LRNARDDHFAADRAAPSGAQFQGRVDANDPFLEELATDAYAVRILDGLHSGPSPAIRQHDGIGIA
jgi:hypothetical protein